MVWPYRESIHYIQDHCLRLDGGRVPNLKERFREYHDNITSKLPWWREQVAPRISVRARMWEGFEIYVGLDPRLREMPNHDDGMLLIGDAAGLESTELCDGVPAAWYSADIAADVAIRAIRANNTSKPFLQEYDRRVTSHAVIRWSTTAKNRFNLRYAQERHDIRLLRKCVHEAWGMGQLAHSLSPLVRSSCECMRRDPRVITRWIKMFFRYYQNWMHNAYEFFGRESLAHDRSKRPVVGEAVFRVLVGGLDLLLRIGSPAFKLLAAAGLPLSGLANPAMRLLEPMIRPLYKLLRKPLSPLGEWLSQRVVGFVGRADPGLFA